MYGLPAIAFLAAHIVISIFGRPHVQPSGQFHPSARLGRLIRSTAEEPRSCVRRRRSRTPKSVSDRRIRHRVPAPDDASRLAQLGRARRAVPGAGRGMIQVLITHPGTVDHGGWL
jgi:hypothetical protein